MSEKKKEVNALVGRIGEEYYICDYLFRYEKGFSGATAIVVTPVGRRDYDEQIAEDEYWYEHWQAAVAAGATRESFEEWASEIDSDDREEILFSPYTGGHEGAIYAKVAEREGVTLEEAREEFPILSTTGGGRSFSLAMAWDELYEPRIWADIVRYEAGNAA
jgi:hypothetical protein